MALLKLNVRSDLRPAFAVVRQVARALLTLPCLLVLVGCGRDDVRVYEAPKDQAATPSVTDPHAGLDMSSGMVAAATRGPSASPLKWQAPAGWKEQPGGQMRAGFFTVVSDNNQQAEVTIIPLSGRAGGDLDNVNRWLGQLGAPPVTNEQLAALTQAVTIAGNPGQFYDLSAPESQAARKHTLAAVLRRDGTAWFFKMTGDHALVAAQKPAFVSFLESVRFTEEPDATPASVSSSTPTPAIAAASPIPATAGAPPPALPALPSAGAKPGLEVPASWQEQPAGAMQLAKYAPSGAAGKAEITVAVLPGDGGGTAANVNRWRRQIGLPPWTESELNGTLQKLDVTATESYLVDLANPGTQKRMLAAGVVRGGQSWFYKLTGDMATVEAERPAFVRFVESARYAP